MYSTSFWQLLRRRWCQTVIALLFLWIHHWRGEGGWGRGGGGGACYAARATVCPPHNTAQTYIHSITYTYFHTWRGHSSFTIRVDATRGATDTCCKPSLDWRRAVYTIKAAREMNDVVFSSSCLQPKSLVVREVLTGHTSSLVAL